MRAHVFTDRALAEQSGRFAWLAVDVENAANTKFLEQFPWEAVPTFLVIDPVAERVIYKWLGSVDRIQLEARLAEALRFHGVVAGGPAADPAGLALAEADRLNGADRKAEAAAAYRRAIELGGPAWPSRARATEMMVLALALHGDQQQCVDEALAAAGAIARGSSFANVVSTGLSCALEADRKQLWRAAAIAKLEPLVQEALALPDLLGDDRSGLYATLLDARDDAGDEAGSKTLAGQWLEFLETATASATSAEERAAYDSHRVSAALAAGDPARVLPALERSARELPTDYNPHARMAIVLRELGRYDDALTASDRALALAYGPRKLTLYEARAAIHQKRGDTAATKQTYRDAIAFAHSLPPSPRLQRTIERLEQKLH